MSSIPTRMALGFAAGAASHVVFQGALSVVYYGVGLLDRFLWSLAPTGALGLPTTIHFSIFAGLWGIAYGLAEPRLTPRVGLITGGLLFGVAAMLVRWFVVLPLQGLPPAEGLEPRMLLVFTGFHLIFGLGLALLYAAGRRLTRRSEPETLPRPLRG
jgi:hypothetical protein